MTHLQDTENMEQRVITEIYSRTDARILSYEPKHDTLIAKALAEGWEIIHVSTAASAGYHYATFVVQRQALAYDL